MQVCLVIGGYGAIGKLVCAGVLSVHKNAKVIICGRSLKKGEDLARQLHEQFPNRTSAVLLDAYLKEHLDSAPEFDVLVNATQDLSFEYITGLMKFANSRHAAYLDVHGAHEAGIQKVASVVGQTEKPMVMSGGVFPGFMAPSVKLGRSLMPNPKHVQLLIFCTADNASVQATDIFDNILCKPDYKVWRNGGWKRISSMDMVKMNLSSPVPGSTKPLPAGTYSFIPNPHYEELDGLPEALSLDSLSGYNASLPGRDCDFMIIMILFACFGRKMRSSLIRRLEHVLAFYFEQYGQMAQLIVHVQGTDESGVDITRSRIIQQPAGLWKMTSDCAVAQLVQILNGTITGNREPVLAGQVTDPEQALDVMCKLGCVASIVDKF